MGQSHLAIPKKSREDFSTKIRVESLPFKSQENSVTVWKQKKKKTILCTCITHICILNKDINIKKTNINV